jgi:hypothetical protein
MMTLLVPAAAINNYPLPTHKLSAHEFSPEDITTEKSRDTLRDAQNEKALVEIVFVLVGVVMFWTMVERLLNRDERDTTHN